MTDIDIDRRKVLKAGGATLLAATAGCMGDGDDGGNGGDDGGDGNGGGDVPSEVDDHLSDANGYDGSVEDMTGQDSVTIENGTNEPDYAFAPAAIRIDSGTEVTWEWVSDGHTVTVTSGPSDVDTAIENEGFTTSETFDESGTVLYECTPHASLGQLGAVIVE
jgi:halocyanin-like protein